MTHTIHEVYHVYLPEADGYCWRKTVGDTERWFCTHGNSLQHPQCKGCYDALLERAALGQFGDPDYAYAAIKAQSKWR